MSKVYFPIRYLDVPASPPHEGDPAYRVSVGVEHWGDGTPRHVFKVQMVYAGAVAGRKSPSYPEDSDDLERVLDALRRVRSGEGRSGRGMMTPVGREGGMSAVEVRDILATQ